MSSQPPGTPHRPGTRAAPPVTGSMTPETSVRIVIDSTTASNPTLHVDRKRRKDALRKRKTNRLLFAIAVVFAGSWLPLNVFNIVADFDHEWVLALTLTNQWVQLGVLSVAP